MTGLSAYAQPIIEAGFAVGAVPKYLSEAFHALPARDPRRHASVLLAAEAFKAFCSREQVAEDMAREVEGDRQQWISDVSNAFLAGARSVQEADIDSYMQAMVNVSDAFRAGQRSVKDASLDVGNAGVVGMALDALQVRDHRAALTDPAVRPGDYMGGRL